MNSEALLALIADLYAQLRAATAELEQLRNRPAPQPTTKE